MPLLAGTRFAHRTSGGVFSQWTHGCYGVNELHIPDYTPVVYRYIRTVEDFVVVRSEQSSFFVWKST
jgi:hypothetical protein